MFFKCCPSKLIYSLSISPSAELIEITIELKIHNIQKIADDFKVSNSSFLQIVYNCLSFSLVRFYGLVYTKTGPFGFVMTF